MICFERIFAIDINNFNLLWWLCDVYKLLSWIRETIQEIIYMSFSLILMFMNDTQSINTLNFDMGFDVFLLSSYDMIKILLHNFFWIDDRYFWNSLAIYFKPHLKWSIYQFVVVSSCRVWYTNVRNHFLITSCSYYQLYILIDYFLFFTFWNILNKGVGFWCITICHKSLTFFIKITIIWSFHIWSPSCCNVLQKYVLTIKLVMSICGICNLHCQQLIHWPLCQFCNI